MSPSEARARAEFDRFAEDLLRIMKEQAEAHPDKVEIIFDAGTGILRNLLDKIEEKVLTLAPPEKREAVRAVLEEHFLGVRAMLEKSLRDLIRPN
jgi:hypothetical protein